MAAIIAVFPVESRPSRQFEASRVKSDWLDWQQGAKFPTRGPFRAARCLYRSITRSLRGVGPGRRFLGCANARWKKMLAEYEAPEIDPAVDEALQAYMRQRKESFPDSNT